MFGGIITSKVYMYLNNLKSIFVILYLLCSSSLRFRHNDISIPLHHFMQNKCRYGPNDINNEYLLYVVTYHPFIPGHIHILLDKNVFSSPIFCLFSLFIDICYDLFYSNFIEVKSINDVWRGKQI